MAKFVKLKNRNYINVDMIVKVVEVIDGENVYYDVYMREHLIEQVLPEDLDNILKASEE